MKLVIEESVLRQMLEDITACRYWRAMSTLSTILAKVGADQTPNAEVRGATPTGGASSAAASTVVLGAERPGKD